MKLPGPTAVSLLFGAALIGSCEPSPSSAPGTSPHAVLKAGDAACPLPLQHFTPSLRRLTGSILSPPYSRVMIDAERRIRWNSQVVSPEQLREYIGVEAASGERIFLLIYPERDAPCTVVLGTLAAAIEAGRCTPRRCAFEWPPGNPPPPPDSPQPHPLPG